MVRTVSNAFETGRIPQAWILTGVRGVGKTTTARILARALNYELPDGSVTGPTIDMPAHRRALPGDHGEPPRRRDRDGRRLAQRRRRHAPDQRRRALRAGVRRATRSTSSTKCTCCRGAAFNALLKTLEEPPPHAKFIFATTEIRKVPVTMLSRCQRFDLRRVDAGVLVEHLGGIAAKENVEAEPEALALIARAAEGSVRDALSLLDQASRMRPAPVRAEDVRQMLGLADRTRIIDLFEALMRGDIAAALDRTARAIRHRRRSGGRADRSRRVHPFRHPREGRAGGRRRRLAVGSRAHARPRLRRRKLSMRVLSRTWQMLLKGIAEVQASGRPLAAAEMVLVRLAYAADLPTPDEVIRSLDGETAAPAPRAVRQWRRRAPAPAPRSVSRRAIEAPRGAPRGSRRGVAAPGRRSGGAARRGRAAAPTLVARHVRAI